MISLKVDQDTLNSVAAPWRRMAAGPPSVPVVLVHLGLDRLPLLMASGPCPPYKLPGSAQCLNIAEIGAAHGFARQDAEPDSHLVEPAGGGSRGKVEMDIRMRIQLGITLLVSYVFVMAADCAKFAGYNQKDSAFLFALGMERRPKP